jgi:hypothetical protein
MTISSRSLAWYTCAMLSALAALMSLVTIAPGHGYGFAVAQASFVGAAVAFGLAAIKLYRLPSKHWANRSGAVRGLLWGAAGVATWLAVASI